MENVLKSNKKVFGTKEWAVKNVNFISGCQHDCKYCYSKEMAIRFRRKTPDNWKKEEVRIKDLEKNYKKYKGRIMIPSSHDITPVNLESTFIILNKLLLSGNDVLIVTKPHFECINKICERFEKFKKQILFRFSIGSNDSSVLKFWEPGATDFQERLNCLKFAHKQGFETSVSCEPMLDYKIDDLIKIIIPFVTNSIWIGKANFLLKRMKTNGINDKISIEKAKELHEWQSNKRNIKNLYTKYKNNPKIKWKESLKKILDIKISRINGLDT